VDEPPDARLGACHCRRPSWALKPVQRPGPPVYLGAVSEGALRRIGRRGDGWLAVAVVPYLVDPEPFVRQRGLIVRAAQDAGRDPAAIDVVQQVNVDHAVPVEQVAAVVLNMAAKANIDHFQIDPMYNADSIAGALDWCLRVLNLINAG
jgi:alkanesulfonate monooxygenase SsuD/methylene tetrahydromethanopterin reductase-like flavin-dependent oxidoreductase (luciferase family)